jgi:LysR family glycine cleavage system transcriptional activator
MSFQDAAKELEVTPTAISHQIKNLEQYLGLSLFIRRNPRPLMLTQAGQQLYPVLRDGLDRFAFTIAHLQTDQTVTELTVTAINDFASKWLVPRLPKFQVTYPDIDIRLQTSVNVIDLKSGTVDMAIRYGHGNYPGLVAIKLLSDAFIPVCSPLLIQQKPLDTLEDLVHHTLIHCEWVNYSGNDQPSWPRWLQQAGATTVDPTRGLTFTGESLAIQAALNGQGVALCSNIHAADDLAKGLLIQPFDTELVGFSFYAVYLPEHPKQEAITHFVDWLEEMAHN